MPNSRAVLEKISKDEIIIEATEIIDARINQKGAELIAYAANPFLATKITFIKEIANLCEKVGADMHDVARGIGLYQRIGAKFLHAGPGFGGSCFTKDMPGQRTSQGRSDAVVNQRPDNERVNRRERRWAGVRLRKVDLLDFVCGIDLDGG